MNRSSVERRSNTHERNALAELRRVVSDSVRRALGGEILPARQGRERAARNGDEACALGRTGARSGVAGFEERFGGNRARPNEYRNVPGEEAVHPNCDWGKNELSQRLRRRVLVSTARVVCQPARKPIEP